MGHPEIRKKMLEMRFTDKQIMVAERLMAGDSPAEICEKAGMKRPALNSLINACYAKADVRSRPKFTALFLLASDF
jgi:DNA-binding CsgD family transcriptional regulator